MQIPFMRLDRQYAEHKQAFRTAIEGVLEHGKVLQGPEVQMLEERLASLFQMKHAAGVASGTDALILALKALGVQRGARVAVTSLSFVASASAIVQAGAIPVFIDIDPQYYCMQEGVLMDLVKANKIDGIVAVHLYGQMMELKEIFVEARNRGIFLIEDAAQVLGATRHGVGPGAHSDAMCVSFDPTKVIGAHGSGGAVLTNDTKLDARIRLLRYHGHSGNRVYDEIGHNSQLPTLQAALLLQKMVHEASWRKRREEIASRYTKALNTVKDVEAPQVRPENTHNYHKYVMAVQRDRDRLSAHLQAKGIATSVHYSLPLHKQPCFRDQHDVVGKLPNVELAVQRVLSLPIYPELTDEEVDVICQTICDYKAL